MFAAGEETTNGQMKPFTRRRWLGLLAAFAGGGAVVMGQAPRRATAQTPDCVTPADAAECPPVADPPAVDPTEESTPPPATPAPAVPTPTPSRVGSTPSDAQRIDNQVWYDVLPAGQNRWFRFDHHRSTDSGVTLLWRPEDRDVRGLVNGRAMLRLGSWQPGSSEQADGRFYKEIGVLTRTENTGEDRKYWQMNGDDVSVFFELRNGSPRALELALIMRTHSDPANFTFPPRG